jgi:hypothetical protein
MRVLSCIFTLVAGLSAASAQGATCNADVPMRFYGNRPAVEVRVNGEGPFLFLIDTGASGIARADASLVARLRLPRTGEQAISNVGVARTTTVQEVAIGELSFGSFSMRQVTAQSRDYNTADYLPHIDGILGIDAFRGCLLTLDYPKARVRVRPGSLAPANGRDILAYEDEEGLPYLPVSFGGLKTKAVLDTGSVRGVDVPTRLIRELALYSYRRVIGRGTAATGDFETSEVTLREDFLIGRYRSRQPLVTFNNFFNHVIIGSAALQAFAVTIDQRNRRIRLVRS